MADSKISDLEVVTEASVEDLVPISSSGKTVAMPFEAFQTAMRGALQDVADQAVEGAQRANTAAEAAEGVVEDVEQAGRDAAREMVDEHAQDMTVHLTETEKKFVNRPYIMVNYTGNGKASRNQGTSNLFQLMVVLCAEHPPVEVDEDGVQHIYWGWWAYTYNGSRGSGGCEMKVPYGGDGTSESFYAYNTTEDGKVFHLNESGAHYTAILVPRYQ